MNFEKRFKVLPMSGDGYYKVVDTHTAAYVGTDSEKFPDIVCKASSKHKADHIAKCLNLYQSMSTVK